MSKYLVILLGIVSLSICLFTFSPVKDMIHYSRNTQSLLSPMSTVQNLTPYSTKDEQIGRSSLALAYNNQWKIPLVAISIFAKVWFGYEVYKTCIHGLLLPASFIPFSRYPYVQSIPDSVAMREFTFVSQGTEVDAVEISSRSQCKDLDKVSYLIFLNGNACMYNDIMNKMLAFAKRTDEFKAFSFNYPKVGMKTRSPQLIMELGIDFVKDLLQREKAKNIVLIGHSMGGAFASCIVAWFHKHNQPIGLITDRSFTCLSTVVASHCGAVPIWLCDIFLDIAGWRLKPAEMVKDIPKAWQCHYVSNADHIIGSSGNTSQYASDYNTKEVIYDSWRCGQDIHNADIEDLRVRDAGAYFDDQMRVIRTFRDNKFSGKIGTLANQ